MTLPRRALLGARLPPDAEAFSPAGALVKGVVAGSMAAAAGLAPGDRLIGLSGAPTRSLDELAAALRLAGGADTTEIRYRRAGATHARTVPVQRMPEERIAGQRVSYGSITWASRGSAPPPQPAEPSGAPPSTSSIELAGARLRTIVTHAEDDTPQPAVLVIQGISCESVDFGADPDAPFAGLVHGWTRAGLCTMRVDKRGVGDSEGEPCRAMDFDTELAGHRAALAALLADPRVDPARVVLFGHSVGGMIAPILAGERRVAAVMVYGTSCARWLDCVVASQRRQAELRGVATEEIERIVAEVRERVRHESPNGRSPAYHEQLDQLDLAAAWARVDAPVLVLRGEHDWVVGAEEQAQIAAIVNGQRPGAARVLDLAGTDHLLSWHANQAASLAAYGTGSFDPAVVDHTVAWITEQALRSPS